MAGDPWYNDCTTTDYWTDTTSTTETSSWGYGDSYTISYTSRYDENDPEYQRKLKELVRREIIKKMRTTWKQNKKEFKPLPKLRPAAQLRGVCFSGRGWA